MPCPAPTRLAPPLRRPPPVRRPLPSPRPPDRPTGPPGVPAGLGTTKDAIRKYLGDSDNPLRVKFEELAEHSPGGIRPDHPQPVKDASGRSTVLHPDDTEAEATAIPNNIRNGGDEAATPPVRDRSREPQAGTSVGYAVRRLAREAARDPDGPAALAYERLKAGLVSANGACVEAGRSVVGFD